MHASQAQPQDDRDLVRRMAAGESAAYETLVRKYANLVFTVALARLGNRESAEDLMQEVFLRAFLNAGSIRNPQYLCTWISRITRNLAADWQRRNLRASTLVSMISLEEKRREMEMTANTTDPCEERARAELAHKLVLELPPQQREVVLLRYVDGYSVTEIARMLGLHRVTVSRVLHAARRCMHSSVESLLGQPNAAGLRCSQGAMAKAVGLAAAVALCAPEAKAGVQAAANLPAGAIAAAEASSWLALGSAAKAAATSAGAVKLAAAGATCLVLAGGVTYMAINRQPATTQPVVAAVPAANTPIASAVATVQPGIYVGRLNPNPRVDVRLVFHLRQSGDAWTGTMDSPDQKASGIPLQSVTVDGASVKIDMGPGNRYEGTAQGADRISGHLVQASAKTPLLLERVQEAPAVERKQRKEVKMSDAELDRYVGRYAVSPTAVIEIFRRGSELFVRLPSQPELSIAPESDTSFFMRNVEAEVVFSRNASGQVDRLVFRQNGREMPGRKVQ